MLRLVFLGRLRPLAPPALGRVEPPATVTTLNDLKRWVGGEAPALGAALAGMPCKLAVNQQIVHDLSRRFHPDDEIAFMPPMSGG